MKTFFTIMYICFFSYLFGEQIVFNKGNLSFKISYEESSYSSLFEKQKVIDVDSLFVINERSDSIYVFFVDKRMIFFCSKKNDCYNLFDVQGDEYEMFFYFFYIDLNNDNLKEIIIFSTNDEEGRVSIFKFDNEYKDLKLIFKHDYYYYKFSEGITDDVKIKNGKIYFLYSPPSTENEKFILKKGMIDFTNDKSKEIYFSPISIITKEEWEKF